MPNSSSGKPGAMIPRPRAGSPPAVAVVSSAVPGRTCVVAMASSVIAGCSMGGIVSTVSLWCDSTTASAQLFSVSGADATACVDIEVAEVVAVDEVVIVAVVVAIEVPVTVYVVVSVVVPDMVFVVVAVVTAEVVTVVVTDTVGLIVTVAVAVVEPSRVTMTVSSPSFVSFSPIPMAQPVASQGTTGSCTPHVPPLVAGCSTRRRAAAVPTCSVAGGATIVVLALL